jgi:hypothetical protein
MNDMTPIIVPKSDQLNAEDFLAGPATFIIEGVAINPGSEQPVNIKLVGEPRVWRPCKSMSRVLVAAWGPDANAYVGRSVTLYRDPKVKWGGLEVGGIRVSHLSHIERDMVMSLTATKGKRAPHKVCVLEAPSNNQPPQQQRQTPEQWVESYIADVNKAADLEALARVQQKATKALEKLAGAHPELHERAIRAGKDRADALNPSEGRAVEDMGEAEDAPF